MTLCMLMPTDEKKNLCEYNEIVKWETFEILFLFSKSYFIISYSSFIGLYLAVKMNCNQMKLFKLVPRIAFKGCLAKK